MVIILEPEDNWVFEDPKLAKAFSHTEIHGRTPGSLDLGFQFTSEALHTESAFEQVTRSARGHSILQCVMLRPERLVGRHELIGAGVIPRDGLHFPDDGVEMVSVPAFLGELAATVPAVAFAFVPDCLTLFLTQTHRGVLPHELG